MSEPVADELVIYDEVRHVAHCLAPEAVAVWACCDGDRSTEEIAHHLTVSPKLVEHALAALAEQGLLEQGHGHLAVYSRRQAAVKLAKAGRVAFVASLIYSVDVGTAAAAASHLAAGCIVSVCGSCNSTTGCALCNTNNTAMNSMCASGRCYCSTSGTDRLRCAIGTGCRRDAQSCTSNGQCCGNLCTTGFPRTCQPASVTC